MYMCMMCQQTLRMFTRDVIHLIVDTVARIETHCVKTKISLNCMYRSNSNRTVNSFRPGCLNGRFIASAAERAVSAFRCSFWYLLALLSSL